VDGFDWAQNNLGAETPHALQGQGVNVYFAPSIRPGVKVVDLATGRVAFFQEDEDRPQEGYFADLESLERYCLERGLPLNETNGLMVLQPAGPREAGDPLRQGAQ
jgi:hypothetical protein